MKDRVVVDYFIDYLIGNGYPRKYPEDERDGDIDAIAGQFAIEHTSIDTLPKQRRDSARFLKAVGGLENEIPKPLFQLNIATEYDAVIKGQKWSEIREAIKSWIINDSAGLPDGQYIPDKVPGVPFRLYVNKHSDRLPGIFFSRRCVPEDDTLPLRICQQLCSKAAKLAKYQKPGIITILLVERYDIALMNEEILINAIQNAYPDGPPHGVDEVWYADTSIPASTIETSTPIEFRNLTKNIWGKEKF